MTISTRYRHHGLVLVRATTDPGDLVVPTRLDIEQDSRAWLTKMLSRAEVREALQMATPALVARADQLLDTAQPAAKDLRRAALAVSSYLLRWQRRATPFGLFAGVTAATIGPATVDIGGEHRAIARPDAEWITMLVDQIERHPGLRPRLTVVADNGGTLRDGRLVVPRRADVGARTPGPLRDVSLRHTTPVRVVLAAAATPIRLDTLAAAVAARFRATPPQAITAMLNSLVDQRILITSLRPPMTATDPLAHLIRAVRDASGDDLDDIRALLDQLDRVQRRLTVHNTATPRQATAIRASTVDLMTGLVPAAQHALATDVRLDARVSIPDIVLAEAERVASVLLRLSIHPFGTTAWLDYHAEFRARYGPGTLVPVRELVADSGLGYPSGYLGAPRARPSWRTLTERDTVLLALIQRAALDGSDEIVLTDADVEALTVGEHADVVPPQRIELGVTLHATSAAAIDRGDFELRVIASPRAHTSMAGRFAPLLDGADRARLADTYAATPGDVVAVQVSFPPRVPHNENVVRVPPVLEYVVSLSEHPASFAVSVDDLAVTADADQMYLVQRSTRRRVIPRVPHALDAAVQTPPLARFLAEVADARTAVWGPFNLGAARTLPYIPRIRYRRTVLSPARWTSTSLPSPSAAGWDAALAGWRREWRVPARVVVCQGELRLPLDLDQPLDRELLRLRLERADRIEVQEDGPPDGHAWIGRPAELLIPMTVTDPPARPLPVMAPPGPVARPGGSTIVHARLPGSPARFDDILARHLPPFAAALTGLVERWWVRRHRNMIRPEEPQHIAVVLRLADAGHFPEVAARLAAFAAGLEAAGLPAQLALVTHYEHPARYGQGPALVAAEQVFAADTAAAVAQIAMADAAHVPAQALAAASMTDLAASFAPAAVTGCRRLLACLPRSTGVLDIGLRDQVFELATPADDYRTVRALPGGDAVADAWKARATALAAYHRVLAEQRDPGTVLRTLLHEHHVRAVGVDPDFEKVTGRLARAAALRRLALEGAL
ncbi:lantibiotic dehydratase [Nonomuraea aridisoli]|uniref:Lantibiotic dehydratase n=1 Tax=Nonomuraea aridisoli TaxID=2070368 RepID=A0A2W2FSK5_9ACTN|nr:lantibiotic dehydratase [Nonomuraea aridisoli]PZG18014.1 lantibiotic dehydratase [Nonomuraea aridisoli]